MEITFADFFFCRRAFFLLPKIIAMGFIEGMFSHTILMNTINGTAKIIPTNPQTHPQIERLTKMKNGDIPKFSPSILGSTMFPKTKFTASIKIATAMMGGQFGKNCTNAKNVVSTSEIALPKVGMKFKRNAMNAQITAKSSLIASAPK